MSLARLLKSRDDAMDDMWSTVIYISLNGAILFAFLLLMGISKILSTDPGAGFIFVMSWFFSMIVGMVVSARENSSSIIQNMANVGRVVKKKS